MYVESKRVNLEKNSQPHRSTENDSYQEMENWRSGFTGTKFQSCKVNLGLTMELTMLHSVLNIC